MIQEEVALGIEPMLEKHFITDLHPQPEHDCVLPRGLISDFICIAIQIRGKLGWLSAKNLPTSCSSLEDKFRSES